MDDAEFQRRLHGDEFRVAHKLTGMVAVQYAEFTPEQRQVAREGIECVFRELDAPRPGTDEAFDRRTVLVVELADVDDLDQVLEAARQLLASDRPVKVYAAIREKAARIISAFRELPEGERPQ